MDTEVGLENKDMGKGDLTAVLSLQLPNILLYNSARQIVHE